VRGCWVNVGGLKRAKGRDGGACRRSIFLSRKYVALDKVQR
jgi:hypothetical protein